MMNHLKEAGIGTGIHYPIPLHLQKAYASLNYSPRRLPGGGTRCCGDCLLANVPAAYSRQQQARVAEEILAFTCNVLVRRVEGEENRLHVCRTRRHEPYQSQVHVRNCRPVALDLALPPLAQPSPTS